MGGQIPVVTAWRQGSDTCALRQAVRYHEDYRVTFSLTGSNVCSLFFRPSRVEEVPW